MRNGEINGKDILDSNVLGTRLYLTASGGAVSNRSFPTCAKLGPEVDAGKERANAVG